MRRQRFLTLSFCVVKKKCPYRVAEGVNNIVGTNRKAADEFQCG